MSVFEVAVEQVDGEAPAGVVGLMGCGVGRVRWVAQGGLPESGVVCSDVEVALLLGEAGRVGGLAAAAVSGGAERVGLDPVGWLGFESVAL